MKKDTTPNTNSNTLTLTNYRFKQLVKKDTTVEVGTIPSGKANVRVELESIEDVDIQIEDKTVSPAKEVVAWPNGLLSGGAKQITDYAGVKVSIVKPSPLPSN